MAKYSKKVMGKEVGDAKVYAEPHTMDGKKMKITDKAKLVDPNTVAAKNTVPSAPAKRVSAGDPAANNIKTSGMKIRGTGAATKGVMARGPMA
jgi:hypothetical protein